MWWTGQRKKLHPEASFALGGGVGVLIYSNKWGWILPAALLVRQKQLTTGKVNPAINMPQIKGQSLVKKTMVDLANHFWLAISSCCFLAKNLIKVFFWCGCIRNVEYGSLIWKLLTIHKSTFIFSLLKDACVLNILLQQTSNWITPPLNGQADVPILHMAHKPELVSVP